jgi:hypothetical protein
MNEFVIASVRGYRWEERLGSWPEGARCRLFPGKWNISLYISKMSGILP